METNIELTNDQNRALEQIMTKLQRHITPGMICPRQEQIIQNPVFIVTGLAGTGKSMLISQVGNALHEYYKNISIAFSAYTGRATSTLKEKLEKYGGSNNWDEIKTLHSLMYVPQFKIVKGVKVISGWKQREELLVNVVLIDEGSMLPQNILNDLYQYNVPVVIFGDHGQLPPVSGEDSNPLKNPDYILRDLCRDYEDEIVKFSLMVRETGTIPYGQFGESIKKVKIKKGDVNRLWEKIAEIDKKNSIILTATNRTRNVVNMSIRKAKKYELTTPYPGERIVCLKNNYSVQIMNGELSTVKFNIPSSNKEFAPYFVELDRTGEIQEIILGLNNFGKAKYDFEINSNIKLKQRSPGASKMATEMSYIVQCDFGYAISVHKAQGSEWDSVFLVEEQVKYWEGDYWKRWLYTAVTRAKKNLIIFGE